ncbi:MAG: 50S ribosomal protein L24 [Bacilli bacterium]|jgi:large subunit ribosomal protein L24
MKLRKGDKVKVIAGANKGTIAEVLHVSYKDDVVWVEGVNMRTKHVKPSQNNPEGRIDQYEAPIHISNVAYYDEKNKCVTKIGYKVTGKEKERISRKTKLPLGKAAKTSGGLKGIIKNRKNVAGVEAKPVGEEKATKAAKKPAAKKNVERKAPTQSAKGGSK